MNIEVVADLNDQCGESPLWDYRTSELHWVDITGNRMHTLRRDSGAVASIASPVPISALALGSNDCLIAAGAAGIHILHADRSPELLVEEKDGKQLSINDSLADPSGRLLAGATYWDGSASGFPLGNLYSIDGNGVVSTLDEGFGLANGMGLSPDESTLYATDSLARTIYAYDYDALTGTARNRRTLVQVPLTEGLPDGLTVDADGFIWSAQWFGSCICRYDPDGRLERRITFPAQQVSSVAFGGLDLTTIFVTTAAYPDALAFAPPNYKPAQSPNGGQLFRFRSDIPGKHEYVCALATSRGS
jgi:D-xylonolactonase